MANELSEAAQEAMRRGLQAIQDATSTAVDGERKAWLRAVAFREVERAVDALRREGAYSDANFVEDARNKAIGAPQQARRRSR